MVWLWVHEEEWKYIYLKVEFSAEFSFSCEANENNRYKSGQLNFFFMLSQ